MRRLNPIAFGGPAGGPRAAGATGLPRARSAFRLRQLAPDLALTGAVAAIVYLLLFFGGPSALFRDADAGWHIRAGEQMIASRALPHTDPFSFSRAGEPWIAWEWGADAMAGLAHRLAGLNGVAFLYVLAIGASVWMWFRLNWAAGGNFLIACLFAAPMLSTTNLHWLARPHVFGWLLLLGAVWFCERMPRRVNATHLVAAGVAGAVWANIHGSFFLGPAILGIYALGAWVGPKIWDRVSLRPTNYLSIALAAGLGSFCNPRGWGLHQHVFSYLFDSALLDRIGEFQSFNFHAAGAAQITIALIIGLIGGVAALSCHRVERFLLAVLLTAGALRSARMLPVAALILLPLANGSITAVLSNAELTTGLRKWLDGALDYGLNLRALDRTMSGFALMPLLALGLLAVVQRTHTDFPDDQFPVAASASMAQLPPGARIFAPDRFGGYLIYRFAGDRKVFFDGRSDFYGADFMKRYSRMVQVRPGWHEEFAGWRFSHALLPVNYSLIPALQAEGWRELYRNRTAVLLERPKS